MVYLPAYGDKAATAGVLHYAQAPAVGFYLLSAYTFGFCVLQKPKPISLKRRRIAIGLAFSILLAYMAEALFYFSCSVADQHYSAPKPSAVNCLGSMLVWTPLGVSLVKAKALRWHAYLGAFVLHFSSEITLCILRALALDAEDRPGSTPFFLCTIRAAFSAVLTVDAFLILIARHGERGTDEEGQSLLDNQANGSTAKRGSVGSGSVNESPSSADAEEEEQLKDRDKDIKEKQAKRLEEEGGWVGYLRGFGIFLPHIWPKDDWVVMGCLAVRAVYVLQGRVLNLLAPRQLGIITDKLAQGTDQMPWKDIGLWTFYSWFNSYSGFGFFNNMADIVIRNKAYARITLMAYKHVMNLSTDFHTNKESGEVLKAVEQASSLNTIMEVVVFDTAPVILDLFIAMWYVTHLFDTYMAFIILFMAGTYIWFGIYFTTWAQARRRKYTEKQRAENQVVNETISNWQTVFYFNRAPFEHSRYGAAIYSTINAYYHHYVRSVGGHVLQDLVMTVGFTSCCIFAMQQIISGRAPVGNLVTFIMYWDTMMSPLYFMAYSYRTISNSLIDAERLLQLLRTKPSVADVEDAKPLVVKEGKVEYKDVDFAYDERKQILKGINLTVEGGQTIAFVGETGGGKTTMIRLLSRAYDVTAGSIMIDGQDIRSVTHSSLLDAIGYVPQDPVLFNRSIRDNIRYGRLDATDAEIEDACRAAAVHDAIESFPDKYNSKVGERGVQLSGGQLQRVAIARVLLCNPKIVLLDEATSAVDSTIEAQIQEAFRKLSAGRTTFVIAHRLSTIVEADQIVVIEKGEMRERGTHQELLELGGKYAELWTHQIAGNLSAMNSQTASTTGDGETSTELLIDITPPEEDIAKAAKATGRDEGSSEGDEGSARKR